MKRPMVYSYTLQCYVTPTYMKVSQNTMAKVYRNTPFFTVYVRIFKQRISTWTFDGTLKWNDVNNLIASKYSSSHTVKNGVFQNSSLGCLYVHSSTTPNRVFLKPPFEGVTGHPQNTLTSGSESLKGVLCKYFY